MGFGIDIKNRGSSVVGFGFGLTHGVSSKVGSSERDGLVLQGAKAALLKFGRISKVALAPCQSSQYYYAFVYNNIMSPNKKIRVLNVSSTLRRLALGYPSPGLDCIICQFIDKV